MELRSLVLVAGVSLGSMSGTAHAAYLFTFTQTASGVLETGSGSLDVSGLYQYDSSTQQGPYVGPNYPGTAVGAPQLQDLYAATFDSDQAFGIGPGGASDSGVGPLVGFQGGSFGTVAVPTGYASGQLGSASTLYAGETFASLGLTLGTYVYNYSYSVPEIDLFARAALAPDFIDTITVQVGTVPLPASAPLFGAALMALGAVGYRLKQKVQAPA